MMFRLIAPALIALAACSTTVQAATYEMFRDPNCGCCEMWAEHVRTENEADIAQVPTQDMAAIKTANGVPQDLWSCHTMIVDGYVIEGHVPAADISRLLEERPAGVKGLAVPGMPMGSPGMDMGGHKQAFQVIAFGEKGRSVFASYPGT
ncbi:DUF411 domain-containing protein [Citromicrobium bathyomarinum]|uniref:DUF411 domain-containing protein n=1 Tax=Citromicrobium bathyomarinum TaxID=72174 RepID=UPI001E3E623E|nr:DUF411 domain-containing protein [Citromicrobium bathyomarinum]MCD1621741.1 DUF411 domain-containing protein [Citromicrobium bathyomarinum]